MFNSRKPSSVPGTGDGGETMAARKQSVTSANIRTQVAGAPPVQQTVKVAVIPPRLPADMAPPTGIGASDSFGWDESINWAHNKKIADEGKPKNFLQKAGLTTQRSKRNPDLPNFTFREVPYDVWRKHYAKDKDGNYRGTHTPAEDCILNPRDVEKWRLEPPVTVADRFTRGREILPAYAEAKSEQAVPEYTDTPDENQGAPRMDSIAPPPFEDLRRGSSFTADGKTTEEIIREAEERAKIKKGTKQQWKDSLRSGVNMVGMGSW